MGRAMRSLRLVPALLVAFTTACHGQHAPEVPDAGGPGPDTGPGPDAGPLGACGTIELAPTDFAGAPLAVGVAPDGALWIASDRISRLGPPHWTWQTVVIGVPDIIGDLAVLPDGTLFYGMYTGKLYRVSPAAQAAGLPATPELVDEHALAYGLAADDATGSLLYFGSQPGTPYARTLRRAFVTGAPVDVLALGDVPDAGDAAVTTDGSLVWSGMFDSQLRRVRLPAGNVPALSEVIGPREPYILYGLAVDAAGRIYYGSGRSIRSTAPDGSGDELVSQGHVILTKMFFGRGALRCDRLYVAAQPPAVLTIED